MHFFTDSSESFSRFLYISNNETNFQRCFTVWNSCEKYFCNFYGCVGSTLFDIFPLNFENLYILLNGGSQRQKNFKRYFYLFRIFPDTPIPTALIGSRLSFAAVECHLNTNIYILIMYKTLSDTTLSTLIPVPAYISTNNIIIMGKWFKTVVSHQR